MHTYRYFLYFLYYLFSVPLTVSIFFSFWCASLTLYSWWKWNPGLCILLPGSCFYIGSFWWSPASHQLRWKEGSLACLLGIQGNWDDKQVVKEQICWHIIDLNSEYNLKDHTGGLAWEIQTVNNLHYQSFSDAYYNRILMNMSHVLVHEMKVNLQKCVK